MSPTGVTGVDSRTGQGQGLGEAHEGDVVVVLLVRIVAIDDDLGDGGRLGQLLQVVGAGVHLPALQDLLPGPAGATGEQDQSPARQPPAGRHVLQELHCGPQLGGRRTGDVASGGALSQLSAAKQCPLPPSHPEPAAAPSNGKGGAEQDLWEQSPPVSSACPTDPVRGQYTSQYYCPQ